MKKLLLPMILSLVGCQTLGETEKEDFYKVGDCFLLSLEGESAQGVVIDKGQFYYVVRLENLKYPPFEAVLHVEKLEFEGMEVVTKIDCSKK